MIRLSKSKAHANSILRLVKSELFPKAKQTFPELEWNREEMLRRLRRGRTYIYLLPENKAAGFIHVISAPPNLWIDMLAVSPEVRSQGIGTALLNRAERYAMKQRNLNCVRLFVDMKNAAAVRFYERRGYVAENVLRDYQCYIYRKDMK